MSDTAQATIDLRPATDDMQTRASEMVLFLLGLAHMKKQDLAPVLGIAPSGVGRAIAGDRRWTLNDLAAMSYFFTDRLGRNVGPGIFFRTVDEVLDHQNWKKMNGPDLRAIDGTAKVTTPKTARLHLVK